MQLFEKFKNWLDTSLPAAAAFIIVVLGIITGIAYIFSGGRNFSFWSQHITMAGIWLTLTLSLNLINGYCGLFSLGHQGFFAAGAYAAGAAVVFIPHGEGLNWTGYALSFPIGFLVAAVFGLLVGLPCLRLRGDYLAIATLGFSEILRNVVQNVEPLGKSLGLSVPNIVKKATSKSTNEIYYIVLAWAFAAFTLLLLKYLIRSPHGRAIQAIRDDERAAELLGVNLTFYKVLVFVTGAGLAGLAGAIFANYNSFVTLEDFSFNQGVLMVVMVVLGGMGNMTGTIMATLVLHFTPILLALWLSTARIPVFYDPTQPGDHWVYSEVKSLWQVIFSLLLIIIVLVRPEGIMSRRAKPSITAKAAEAP